VEDLAAIRELGVSIVRGALDFRFSPPPFSLKIADDGAGDNGRPKNNIDAGGTA
jgi:hypothetical protein